MQKYEQMSGSSSYLFFPAWHHKWHVSVFWKDFKQMLSSGSHRTGGCWKIKHTGTTFETNTFKISVSCTKQISGFFNFFWWVPSKITFRGRTDYESCFFLLSPSLLNSSFGLLLSLIKLAVIVLVLFFCVYQSWCELNCCFLFSIWCLFRTKTVKNISFFSFLMFYVSLYTYIYTYLLCFAGW